MHAVPRIVGLVLVVGLLSPGLLDAREEVPETLDPGAPRALPDVDFETLEPALEPRLRAGLEGIEAMRSEEPLPEQELAAAYGVLGQMLVAVGQYGPARTAFTEAAALSSEARWHHLLGLAAQADGDLEAAVKAYRAALSRDPDYVPALIRAGETMLERGYVDGAAGVLTRALEKNPDDPGALRGAGRVALRRGDPARAIEHLERALELSPFASSLHTLLAEAYEAAGNAGRALYHRARAGEGEMIPVDPFALEISRLSQVLTLEVARRRAQAPDFSERAFLGYVQSRLAPIPSAPEGLEGLAGSLSDEDSATVRGRLLWASAEIFASRGAWDEVGRTVERALDLDPGLAGAHYLSGEFLRRSNESDRARAALERAIALDPDHRRAREALGAFHAAAGDLAAALEQSRALGESFPDDVDVALRTGDLLMRLGRVDEARTLYRRFADEAGDGRSRARALVGLGGLERRGGDGSAAEEAYRRARQEDPQLVPAILGEAGLLARRGELAAAALAYREAIDLLPLDERSRQLEAGALILDGRHVAAVERLEEGLAVLPDSVGLRALLARHLAATPDPEVREGARAVELAREVHAAAPSPAAIETLAMALAEAGRFEEAVTWQERLLRETREQVDRTRLEGNLDRYRRNLACCAAP